MKNKIFKSIAKFIIEVIIVTAILMLFSIFTEGMFLIGVPSVEDVNKVTILYPSVTEEVKEITFYWRNSSTKSRVISRI